jgi:hypothetical protein
MADWRDREYWKKIERKQQREKYLPYIGGFLTVVFYYLLKWLVG